MMRCIEQGVILAAGHGSRFRPLSWYCPKPLHQVCNKPIIQYQLEAMRDVGVCNVAIVIGHNGLPIEEYFGDGQSLGMRIEYITDAKPSGISYSLAHVENWVKGPFLVFLGDIFLSFTSLWPALLPLIDGAAGSIVVRTDTLEAIRRNFAVVTDDSYRVTQVIEKPSDPPTLLKGCGVYGFNHTIFDAIRRTPRSPLRNEFELTDAIQVLINERQPVFAAEVVKWDMNINNSLDLLNCNIKQLTDCAKEFLIGESAIVGDDVHLRSSIREQSGRRGSSSTRRVLGFTSDLCYPTERSDIDPLNN
jgi:dTDP-glucose pyrophosphorylase